MPLATNSTSSSASSSSRDIETTLDASRSLRLDKEYRVTYLIILIHGIGVLLPWNMFLTASDYFKGQFNEKDEAGRRYAQYFTSCLAIAGSLPNLIVQAVNFYARPSTASLSRSIYFAITSEQCIFIGTIVVALFSWTHHQATFFAITIISVVLINLINGLYQNSVYGIVAILPSPFMNACIIGMNISGTVTSIVMILSLAVSSNGTTAAIIYFATAVAFLALCTGTFIYLRRMPYFQFYWDRVAQASPSRTLEQQVNFTAQAKSTVSLRELKDTLSHAKVQCFNVFFCMFISLSVFPVILQNIKSPNNILGDYFTVVYVFFIFNFFAVIGNISVEWLPKIPANKLWIFVLSRSLFIPYFLLCNYRPTSTRVYEPIFYNETFLLLGNMLLGFTSGLASSLGMMYAVNTVEQKNISTAGMLSSFSLILGIFSGVCASFLLPLLV